MFEVIYGTEAMLIRPYLYNKDIGDVANSDFFDYARPNNWKLDHFGKNPTVVPTPRDLPNAFSKLTQLSELAKKGANGKYIPTGISLFSEKKVLTYTNTNGVLLLEVEVFISDDHVFANVTKQDSRTKAGSINNVIRALVESESGVDEFDITSSSFTQPTERCLYIKGDTHQDVKYMVTPIVDPQDWLRRLEKCVSTRDGLNPEAAAFLPEGQPLDFPTLDKRILL